MKILDVRSAPEKPILTTSACANSTNTENAQVMHIELKPGEKLKKHITPVDVFFYVLEGKGTVEIGDETEEVSRDMIIESPAKIPHHLLNERDSLFRVLVVKVPRQTEETRLL